MNYTNGKIYTIKNKNDTSLIYVGSTIQTLEERFRGHKKDCKIQTKNSNHKLYNTVNNDWSDWYIELYELYPCDNRTELFKYEGKIIREIGTLNTFIAGRSIKEWFIENDEKVKEYQKQYRSDNVIKIREKKHIYNIEYCKKYNEGHKEERLNYSRMYEKTKRNKTRIICNCGGFYQQKYKKVHEATKLHQNYLLSQYPAGSKDEP